MAAACGYASKRCQGGKVERYSDLLLKPESPEVLDVSIAVVGDKGDRDQQAAGHEGEQALAVNAEAVRLALRG